VAELRRRIRDPEVGGGAEAWGRGGGAGGEWEGPYISPEVAAAEVRRCIRGPKARGRQRSQLAGERAQGRPGWWGGVDMERWHIGPEGTSMVPLKAIWRDSPSERKPVGAPPAGAPRPSGAGNHTCPAFVACGPGHTPTSLRRRSPPPGEEAAPCAWAAVPPVWAGPVPNEPLHPAAPPGLVVLMPWGWATQGAAGQLESCVLRFECV
jgi:hypothetical protein